MRKVIVKNDNEISDVDNADYRVKLLVAATPKQVKTLSGEVTFDINSYLGLPRIVNFIDY